MYAYLDDMNNKNTISEQTIIDMFGEPLSSKEITEATQNWSEYKAPRQKPAKKKAGPKRRDWGTKRPKKISPKLDD